MNANACKEFYTALKTRAAGKQPIDVGQLFTKLSTACEGNENKSILAMNMLRQDPRYTETHMEQTKEGVVVDLTKITPSQNIILNELADALLSKK